jgi:hypothetical protein
MAHFFVNAAIGKTFLRQFFLGWGRAAGIAGI